MVSQDNTTQDTLKSVQTFTGTVVSAKMAKTVVVEVRSRKRHPKYHKSYTVSKRYKAHVENGDYEVGDTVEIAATKPISADKHFRVVRKV